MIFFRVRVCFILLFYSLFVSASPYVGTQDKQLHYDLQTLAEWGYLDLAVTTFPVPWKGVAQGLENLSPEDMPFRARQAYMRLNHYLQLNKRQENRRFLTLQGASDEVRFRSFDDGVEETGKLSISSEFYAGRWSGQLTANYAKGGEKNFDNSFIAYQFGDWNLRLGSLDQWWGPAQSSSLIMSNNARPIKALTFSRSTNTQSESAYLSWIGPWFFTTQLGQLEDNRAVSRAKMLSSRFNFKPINNLEVGLSWSAMWGGENQDQSLKSFIELVTFQNICSKPNDDCTAAELSKRGNHIAGFDVKYTVNLFDRPISLYLQRIGEDSVDGYKVTDNANLFGLSTYWQGAKIFIETSDTKVACSGSDSNYFNCYYENGTYLNGYRLYNRSIGSTFDTDTKQVTIGANIRFESGNIAEIYLRSADINSDENGTSPVLTKDIREELVELSGYYQVPFGNWLVKAGGTISNHKYVTEENETDGLFYLKAQLAF